MNCLLDANFKRLWKNKCFWFCMGVMFVYIFQYMWNCCHYVVEDMLMDELNFDYYYFQFALAIGLFCGVFSTIFLSREYSDGAVRNKIIAGYKRRNIYLSHLAVIYFASLLILLVGIITALIGLPTFGLWKMGVEKCLLYLLVTAMFTLAFCAIYTLINILIPNRGLSAVLTILLFLVLFLVSIKIFDSLHAPAVVFQEISFDTEEVNFRDPMPNPRYVDGMKREILDFIMDLLPTGQAYRVAYLDVVHPVRMIFCSLGLTALVIVFGIFQFERQDLK